MAKRGNKASGADNAKGYPVQLVIDGERQLSVEEIIDHLFEVAADATSPDQYGLADRGTAENLLKGMGKPGRNALARAVAKRASETPATVAAPVTALDPAGPDDDFEPEVGSYEAPADVPEIAAPPAVASPAPKPAAPAPVSDDARTARIEALRAMTHEQLESVWGKTTPAKDSLLRCWIVIREFGNGKVAKPAPAAKAPKAPKAPKAAPKTAADPVDPRLAFAKLVTLTFDAFKALQDKRGQEIVAGSAFAALNGVVNAVLDDAAAAVDVPDGDERVAETEEIQVHTAESPAASAPPAVSETPAAASAPEAKAPGRIADIAPAHQAKYIDALTAEQMQALTVLDRKGGLTTCRTADGAVVSIKSSHLVTRTAA
jgi:hypothetical protein